MAAQEGCVLDGLDLNNLSGDYVMREFNPGLPAKRPEWVQGADADGSALVRDPLFDNREVTFQLRVKQQSTMDLALAKIGAIVDKLEEAERQPDGLALVWTPATSTKSLTFYVLSGEITNLPVTKEGADRGWFLRYPVINVRLTCKPFLYGTEVTGSTTTSSALLVTLTQAGVTGDVPAEARLVVTDMATQNRRHVEWGLEQRYYNAATSLILDSDDMVVTGFSGAQTTRTGAYDPNATGNNVIRATVGAQPTAVCGTGNLGHVGTFRVKCRAWCSGLDVRVRLVWQEGDGPLLPNPYAVPPLENDFTELDLGVIMIPPKTLGTQRWTGRVEAYSALAGDTVDVDVLQFIPCAEGYGKARGAYSFITGAMVARDEFTAMTSGTVLNARAAPSGGTWATSGAATDLTASDLPTTGDETMQRATTSDAGYRYAILGATNYTDVEVGTEIQVTTGSPRPRLFARWTDSSNYAWAEADFDPSTNVLRAGVVVAGASTQLIELAWPRTYNAWHQVRLVVYATGRLVATILQNGAVAVGQDATHSALATAGALATGKPGFGDLNTGGACTRYYDKFYAAIPTAEQIACFSGQSIEFRSDDPIREDSSGTYWGSPPSYRGSRFLLPAAGDEARTSRVAVKARRNDVDVAPDTSIADSTKVDLFYTPRYLAIPR